MTIDRFGGLDALHSSRQPVPQVGPGQVLVKVSYAGVGTWDPLEREGVFVEITGETPSFPHTLGGDGSGTIAAIGPGVDRFAVGDEVYAMGGGFYAEYVALDADAVSLLPYGLALDQAGAMPIAALTALHGLVNELEVAPGETLLINGASGDTGHIAVQLAKRLGARVLAVASGNDGVDAVRELGADAVIDGKVDDIAAKAGAFAPAGLDTVLTFIGGPSVDAAVSAVRHGGRVAYPLGVEPEPKQRAGVAFRQFDLTLDAPATLKGTMTALNELIASGPFQVKVSEVFPLHQAASAQKALGKHRVGKIVLSMGTPTSG